MERKRFFIRKKDVVLSAGLAAALSTGFQGAHAKDPYVPEAYPESIFQPVTIADYEKTQIEVSPSPSLSEEEKKQLEIQKDKSAIVSLMKSDSQQFSEKYIQDVEIYYPIYKAVSNKYGLDWYLLFIVHENETGASAGTRGFEKDSYYKGAMQRDPNIWAEDFVNEASKGLEELANLPQRQKDDWKEIAAGASILDRNIDRYKDLGNDQAVLNALLLYSNDSKARERFELYRIYSKIFGNSSGKPLKPV